MRHRVVVTLQCTYVVEADDPDTAEAMAILMIPNEANDIEIVATTVIPEAH